MRSHIEPERANMLYHRGVSDLSIARILGVSNSSVHRWRAANNLPANNPRPECRRPANIRACLPKEQAERVLKVLALLNRGARQGGKIDVLAALRRISVAV